MEKTWKKIAIGAATTVIGGLALRFLTGITLSEIIAWVWKICCAFFRLLREPITVPIWLFAIVALLAAPVIWKAVAMLTKSSAEPSKSEYTEDQFDGLVWRWAYGFSGIAHEPWCYCPHCDSVLVYRDAVDFTDAGSMKHVVHLSCERCGSRMATLDGDREYIVARTRRLIDRKLRVGEWREVVERLRTKAKRNA